jgi:hypothetical protein
MKGLQFNLVGNDVWGYVFHSFNTLSFTATNQQYNVILRAAEDATITHVGFNFNARNGAPGDFIFRIGGVGADGHPSATIYASATIASSAITYGGASGSLYWGALSSSYNVTRGQILSCTVIASTGTWDASNNVTLNYQLNTSTEANGNRSTFPYASRGSARQNGVIGGMRSSTTAYGYPITGLGVDTYNFTSTRYGTRFTVPTGMGASVRLAGIRFRANNNSASDYDIKVGSISGSTVTEIYALNVDTDMQNSSAEGYTHDHVFPTAQTLTAGAEYVIGIMAGFDNVQYANIKLTSAIDRTAFAHSIYGTVKSGSWTSAGAWTDDDTRLYMIVPFIDLITASSGGGGGMIVHPGMSGGMRG